MALTTELTEVRPVDVPRIQGVQDTTTADIIQQAGDIGVNLYKQGVLGGAEQELEALKSQQLAPSEMTQGLQDIEDASRLQESQDASIRMLGDVEKKLQKARDAAKNGPMSESLFKAKAAQILKHYANLAPGMTAEIKQVATRVLGSDPSIDLLRATFQREVGAEAKSEFDQRYEDYVAEARAIGHLPIPQSAFQSGEEFELAYANIMAEKKKQLDLSLEIKAQGYNATAQTNNLNTWASIEGQRLPSSLAQIWSDISSAGTSEAKDSARVRGLAAVRNLKQQLMSQAQSIFPKAQSHQKALEAINKRLQEEETLLNGKDYAEIATNRTQYHRSRVEHDVFSEHNDLGYRILALGDFTDQDTALMQGLGDLVTRVNLNIQDWGKIPDRFKGLLLKQGPDGEIIIDTSKTVPPSEAIEDLIDQASKNGADVSGLKDTILNDIVNPVLHKWASSTKDDSVLQDQRAIDVVGMIAGGGYQRDSFTPTENRIVEDIIMDMNRGVQGLLDQKTNTGKRPFKVELKGDRIVIVRDVPSIGAAMFGSSYKLPGSQGELSRDFTNLAKAMNEWYAVPMERIVEIWNSENLEDKADMAIELGADPEDVNKAKGSKGLSDDEMKAEPPEPEASLDPRILQIKQAFPEATFEEVVAFLGIQNETAGTA